MMRNSGKTMLALVLCIVLIAAAALTGCTATPPETTVPPSTTPDVTVLGEGSKVFPFTIVFRDGRTASYEIHTDAEMVGEALMELELIDGEQGPYGLYVKTVGGEKLDYETDGMYWSFYADGIYGMTGVDLTPIEEGILYEFRAEEG